MERANSRREREREKRWWIKFYGHRETSVERPESTHATRYKRENILEGTLVLWKQNNYTIARTTDLIWWIECIRTYFRMLAASKQLKTRIKICSCNQPFLCQCSTQCLLIALLQKNLPRFKEPVVWERNRGKETRFVLLSTFVTYEWPRSYHSSL